MIEDQLGRDAGQLLTVKEVAQALRVSEPTIRRYLREGLLPGVSLPKRGKRTIYRVPVEAIDRILEG